MARWIRKALMTASLVALLVCISVISGGRTQAASAAPIDIASLSRNCAAFGVHLHGAQQTFTCRQAQTGALQRNAGRIGPASVSMPNTTYFYDCNQNSGGWDLEIVYGSYPFSYLCIWTNGVGSGYLGLGSNAPFNVIEVINGPRYRAWFLKYITSGSNASVFCNLSPGSVATTGAYKITQVNIGGYHNPGSSC